MKKIIDFKAVLTDISRTYEFVYLLISAKEWEKVKVCEKL